MVWLVLLSLLLHGLLLLVSLRSAAPPETAERLSIELLRPTPPVEPSLPEAPPAQPPSDPAPAPRAPAPMPQAADEPAQAAQTAEDVAPVEAEPEHATPDVISLRAQIIAGIQQREAATVPDDNRAARPAAAPRTPDAPGWLNDHVGPVQPSRERWSNPDGSAGTRHVLADGTVICGRVPPPTSADIFGFDIRIVMYSVCGRERPPPIDRSDPWQRPPPARGPVQPSANASLPDSAP